MTKFQINSFCCLQITTKNTLHQHTLLKPVFPNTNQIRWLIYSCEYAVILQNKSIAKLYCELVILRMKVHVDIVWRTKIGPFISFLGLLAEK